MLGACPLLEVAGRFPAMMRRFVCALPPPRPLRQVGSQCDTNTVVVIATELSAACLTRLQGWDQDGRNPAGNQRDTGADEVSNRDSCLFIRRPWNFSILPGLESLHYLTTSRRRLTAHLRWSTFPQENRLDELERLLMGTSGQRHLFVVHEDLQDPTRGRTRRAVTAYSGSNPQCGSWTT